MAKKVKGVPVTMRALVQRINRGLARRDGCMHGQDPMCRRCEENGFAPATILKASRGERARLDLGEFYVLDVSGNSVLSKQIDPEELGRELGVLHAWERVAEV